MNNHDTLTQVFTSILEIDASEVTEDLKYQGIAEWDSINHMFLISELENVFEIEIDSDDILEVKTFPDTNYRFFHSLIITFKWCHVNVF